MCQAMRLDKRLKVKATHCFTRSVGWSLCSDFTTSEVSTLISFPPPHGRRIPMSVKVKVTVKAKAKEKVKVKVKGER